MDEGHFNPLDDDGDLSWGEIWAVFAMVVVCLVGGGYIALRLVGLL